MRNIKILENFFGDLKQTGNMFDPFSNLGITSRAQKEYIISVTGEENIFRKSNKGMHLWIYSGEFTIHL